MSSRGRWPQVLFGRRCFSVGLIFVLAAGAFRPQVLLAASVFCWPHFCSGRRCFSFGNLPQVFFWPRGALSLAAGAFLAASIFSFMASSTFAAGVFLVACAVSGRRCSWPHCRYVWLYGYDFEYIVSLNCMLVDISCRTYSCPRSPRTAREAPHRRTAYNQAASHEISQISSSLIFSFETVRLPFVAHHEPDRSRRR